jgi:hypothetical protein
LAFGGPAVYGNAGGLRGRGAVVSVHSIALAALATFLSSCGPKPAATDDSAGASTPPAQGSTPESTAVDADRPVAHASSVAQADPGGPDAAEGPAPVADPLGPLPAQVRARFEALPRDPKPPELVRQSHYWVSNEFSHFLWRDEIANKGGAYVGVGTDQNFLLAAWARSELLVVVDFDLAIVALHRVYAVLFDAAETPDELIRLWSPAAQDDVLAMLDAAYADDAELEEIKRAYKIGRASVHARLRGVRKRHEARGIPTFLSDADEYEHIRTLWRNGRVFAVRGDYTANATLVALGKALRESGLELRVFYLSNVEQYIEYTPEVRRNILGLPFSEDSVVLRTLGWKGFGTVEGETYHYAVQPGRNFASWLRTSRISQFPQLLYFRTKTPIEGYSKIDREPKVSKRPPEIAD